MCDSTPADLLADFSSLYALTPVRVHSHFTELCRVALSGLFQHRRLAVRSLLLPLPLAEPLDTLGNLAQLCFTHSVFALEQAIVSKHWIVNCFCEVGFAFTKNPFRKKVNYYFSEEIHTFRNNNSAWYESDIKNKHSRPRAVG